ncbi:uncharacterized protein LOC126973013 [Leptidea sinapis]|uniref:Ig-like domain-containing protein n=1 Tax=Leptidea sinapis TaxID=189913 RepID=A0A5E4QTZ6_9NEOP|nr:uncharacterized protein LOC126973013 [Leptidea sinapis]VVD01080.1 unnamed protein product [Leptidea sinapis]
MLVGILLMAGLVSARQFNITDFIIPQVVPPGQEEIEIECRYDANFTLLSWFKGPIEFFRYKPGAAPSTRSFPILGVGRIELIACGPTACRLKLGALTEEATGLYRCDIERDVPPYQFESRTGLLEVHGHKHRRPSLEGLADVFGEEDDMKAYCRGAQDAEIRWYINGREVDDARGSPTLKRKSSRLIFVGIPPTVTVQCAEYRYGKLSGSNQEKARWKEMTNDVQQPEEQRNTAHGITLSYGTYLVYLVLCVYVAM